MVVWQSCQKQTELERLNKEKPSKSMNKQFILKKEKNEKNKRKQRTFRIINKT